MGPILPGPLADLLTGKIVSGGSGSGSGGGRGGGPSSDGSSGGGGSGKHKNSRVGVAGGRARGCWCGTMRTYPPFPFRTGRNFEPSCIGSGITSVPPYQSILISKIYPQLASNPSKSTAIGSVTTVTPSAGWTNLRNNLFLRHGGRLQLPASCIA